MFDFPAAPLVGDEFTAGGVTYSYTGTTWDLKSGGSMIDYVAKAGDVMTGELGMTGVPVRYTDRSYPAANASEMVLTCDNKGYPNWNKASLRYSSDGYTKGWLEIWDTDGKSISAKPGSVEFARGINFGVAVVSAANDHSRHLRLWEGGSNGGFGINVTSGRLNFNVDSTSNTFWFRAANADKISLGGNGVIGPLASHNVIFQNGMTGTMDFRVSPSMVTLRILNVKTTNAQVGSVQHVKICDYPAGVPAPWGNLYVHVEGCSDTAFTFLGRHAMVSAQTTGVFLSMYGGSTPEDFPANTYFSCTISWSR